MFGERRSKLLSSRYLILPALHHPIRPLVVVLSIGVGVPVLVEAVVLYVGIRVCGPTLSTASRESSGNGTAHRLPDDHPDDLDDDLDVYREDYLGDNPHDDLDAPARRVEHRSGEAPSQHVA